MIALELRCLRSDDTKLPRPLCTTVSVRLLLGNGTGFA